MRKVKKTNSLKNVIKLIGKSDSVKLTTQEWNEQCSIHFFKSNFKFGKRKNYFDLLQYKSTL